MSVSCPTSVCRTQLLKQLLQVFSKHTTVLFPVAFRKAIVFGSGGFTLSIALWSKGSSKLSEAEQKRKDVLTKADALYDAYMIEELRNFLAPHKDSDDVEILWRLARVTYELAKLSSNASDEKKLVFAALAIVENALKLEEADKCSAVHKWCAILLDATAKHQGTKAQIHNAYKIKEHLQKAIELNPLDATSWHILGIWHYTFATLPWYSAKLAALVFEKPPSSTCDEALQHFLKAESISPNFYSKNLLYIGKTHLQMGNKTSARAFLKQALDMVVTTQDDITAHREAAHLLETELK